MESTAARTGHLTERFQILEEIKNLKNSHGKLFVGVRPGTRIATEDTVSDMKQYYIIKRPNESGKSLKIEDVEQLEKEYQVFEAVGDHINLIRKEEYHNDSGIVYLALDYAIAKSLFHYLTTMGRILETENTISFNNERWARYLFRQFIAGLQKIHEAGIAHLDIKVENVLVDIANVDGMWQPIIKIADFGMSRSDIHNISTVYGKSYGAPEILDGLRPYDGEKADAFASAFILLAIFAI